jgi:hypothetical protein
MGTAGRPYLVAVLLDVVASDTARAERCRLRGRVVLLVRSAPAADDFQAAIAVGARHVFTLPVHDREFDGGTVRCRHGVTRRGSA